VTTLQKLRIGFIASPIQTTVQPFAGGMEAHTVALAGSLRERGHEVTIHAGGSGFGGRTGQLHLRFSEAAQGDVGMPSRHFLAERHAYLSLMVSLDDQGYDIVHNNCLHYLGAMTDRYLDAYRALAAGPPA